MMFGMMGSEQLLLPQIELTMKIIFAFSISEISVILRRAAASRCDRGSNMIVRQQAMSLNIDVAGLDGFVMRG